ncbi:sigma-54-dependent transcriptional regulator [Methylocucumis oryzae]|uniref:Chemotaxis protein CheY n=1 Tax=Methylocucumis oryzae TaxID=1632867 RepID=A0A0F3II12_9GAMM|nr:sigma-54 dependent transcriptional regulator [Methylocucumis oryzae]KJV06445.1 chemotaxis protein CheY [Methylocucumis oryzae]
MPYQSISSLPVLLVDDEPQLLHSASLVLRASGITHVIMLDDSRAVLPLLAQQAVGVVILDLTMPYITGQELLNQIAAEHPEIAVIMMTATNDLQVAVQCMQAGACDYLLKPVDKAGLLTAVRRAFDNRVLQAELLSLKDRLLTNKPHEPQAFNQIVTQSPAMYAIFRYIEAVASSPQPVLITGETGTGKELIAHAIHQQSKRPGELVAVNVAGLDDQMFSDTLFGHAKGAFTGADRVREGLVSNAGEGTLFLDEIGDLTLASQVKLLRLLQDGTYYPLGSDRPRQNRARIVVATHCDVKHSADNGTFRKDLYFRLRTHHIQLPALRERVEDLPFLVQYFVAKAADVLHKTTPTIPPALFQWLKNYPFPGNIRELEGMVFDAVTRCQGTVLPLQSFKEASVDAGLTQEEEYLTDTQLNFPERLPTLKESEDALIAEALRRADGNQGVAAGLLGISRQALNKRLLRRE